MENILMADVIGLSDVSSEDTGKGKKLKTGNLKRSYNMPGKDRCKKYKGKEREDCLNYRGKFYNLPREGDNPGDIHSRGYDPFEHGSPYPNEKNVLRRGRAATPDTSKRKKKTKKGPIY
jgi:hypothetical protein